MPLQQFPEAELQAKAVELGLVAEGQDVPNAVMGKVKAAIVEDRRTAKRQDQPAAKAKCAKEIVVQPGGAVLIDGVPFPWLIAKVPMEIGLHPEGISTVRMTLLAEAVQVIKPEPNTSKESE